MPRVISNRFSDAAKDGKQILIEFSFDTYTEEFIQCFVRQRQQQHQHQHQEEEEWPKIPRLRRLPPITVMIRNGECICIIRHKDIRTHRTLI